MDFKDLTPEEREFIKKYRKLDSYEKGRVYQEIIDLEKDERKSKFTIYDGKEAKK